MRKTKPPAETPAQIAARQAEEQRIATAEGKSQAQEISALKRLQDRRTRQVLRAFGGRNATAALGGLGGMAGLADIGGGYSGGGFASGGAGFGGGGGGGGGGFFDSMLF